MRSTVVLPDPDGPSIEKNSPGLTSRSIPSTALTTPNALLTPDNATAPGTSGRPAEQPDARSGGLGEGLADGLGTGLDVIRTSVSRLLLSDPRGCRIL
ncbi:hypothetical protein [Kitasatospora sp. NPDC059803]|uniref:hypothetical protein n=1 Tax=Kitasatospora sp. NPDC059803 TaxID=3346953 RepID=UPI00364BBA36